MWEKVGGTWKQLNGQHAVNVSSTNKRLLGGWENVSGTWKRFYTSFDEPPTTITTETSSSIEIPHGAARVRITILGEGGTGGNYVFGSGPGQGGGGAGETVTDYALTSNDWGHFIDYQVGGPVFYSGVGYSMTLDLYGALFGLGANGGGGDDGDGTDNGHGAGGGAGLDSISTPAIAQHDGTAGGYSAGGVSTGTFTAYGLGQSGQATNGGPIGTEHRYGAIKFEWFGS